jgi:phospholipase/lecithinase/hemolysin
MGLFRRAKGPAHRKAGHPPLTVTPAEAGKQFAAAEADRLRAAAALAEQKAKREAEQRLLRDLEQITAANSIAAILRDTILHPNQRNSRDDGA